MAVTVGSARSSFGNTSPGDQAGGKEVSTQDEEWRDIVEFEGIYQVSNLGHVRSLPRLDARGWRVKGKILVTDKPWKAGYPIVNLKDGKNHQRLAVPVHRLVAETFIPNINNLPQVNHIDGNKMNNRVENLEWVLCIDNLRHALKTGLMKNHFYTMAGEANHKTKITDAQVMEIRRLREEEGKTCNQIARLFNISKETAWAIMTYKTHLHGSGIWESAGGIGEY